MRQEGRVSNDREIYTVEKVRVRKHDLIEIKLEWAEYKVNINSLKSLVLHWLVFIVEQGGEVAKSHDSILPKRLFGRVECVPCFFIRLRHNVFLWCVGGSWLSETDKFEPLLDWVTHLEHSRRLILAILEECLETLIQLLRMHSFRRMLRTIYSCWLAGRLSQDWIILHQVSWFKLFASTAQMVVIQGSPLRRGQVRSFWEWLFLKHESLRNPVLIECLIAFAIIDSLGLEPMLVIIDDVLLHTITECVVSTIHLSILESGWAQICLKILQIPRANRRERLPFSILCFDCALMLQIWVLLLQV